MCESGWALRWWPLLPPSNADQQQHLLLLSNRSHNQQMPFGISKEGKGLELHIITTWVCSWKLDYREKKSNTSAFRAALTACFIKWLRLSLSSWSEYPPTLGQQSHAHLLEILDIQITNHYSQQVRFCSTPTLSTSTHYCHLFCAASVTRCRGLFSQKVFTTKRTAQRITSPSAHARRLWLWGYSSSLSSYAAVLGCTFSRPVAFRNALISL